MEFVPSCTRSAGHSEHCHKDVKPSFRKLGQGGETGGTRWDPHFGPVVSRAGGYLHGSLVVTQHAAETLAPQTVSMPITAMFFPLPEVTFIFCLWGIVALSLVSANSMAASGHLKSLLQGVSAVICRKNLAPYKACAKAQRQEGVGRNRGVKDFLLVSTTGCPQMKPKE